MIETYKIFEIEEIEGIAYDHAYENQGVLPKWYKSIRNTKLSQLSDGDLIRLVRQNIFLEYILHECITRLYKNPISGEKYSGEMITVLTNSVESSFWKHNCECRKLLIDFIEYIRIENLITKSEELYDFEKEEILDSIEILNKNLG